MVKIQVGLASADRFINVSFATDEVAAAYITRNRDRFLFEEPEGLPVEWILTYRALWPTCPHGLSLDLCSNPSDPNGHYPADSPWDDFI